MTDNGGILTEDKKGRFPDYNCKECGYKGQFEVQENTQACPRCGHEVDDYGREIKRE